MQRFRTTVSLVFWSETTEESTAVVGGLTALLPDADQAATLATVEYIDQGRPMGPPPVLPISPTGGLT